MVDNFGFPRVLLVYINQNIQLGADVAHHKPQAVLALYDVGIRVQLHTGLVAQKTVDFMAHAGYIARISVTGTCVIVLLIVAPCLPLVLMLILVLALILLVLPLGGGLAAVLSLLILLIKILMMLILLLIQILILLLALLALISLVPLVLAAGLIVTRQGRFVVDTVIA